MRDGGVLEERDTELASLSSWWAEAAAGSGRLVLVGGDAGAGKTSLVAEFLRRLRGVRVLQGAVEALATPVPLGPFRDMADDLPGELRALLTGTHDPVQVRRQLLDELMSCNGPTLVVVEDAHWADEATLDLLRYLGRRLEPCPAPLPVLLWVLMSTRPSCIAERVATRSS